MARTQVYLTQDLVAEVRELALVREQSEASLIRTLLRAGLEKEGVAGSQKVSSLIGKYGSGKRNTSNSVDEILYGKS